VPSGRDARQRRAQGGLKQEFRDQAIKAVECRCDADDGQP